MPRFYWEDDGRSYPFERSKRYLIYFIGSFSPPHTGHWSAFEEFLNKPNCEILLSHSSGSQRHGISTNLTRKILNIYSKDYENKITIVKRCCNNEILKYTHDIDVVVCLRGDEGQSHRSAESRMTRQFRNVSDDLRSKGKFIDFYFNSRPLLNMVSSTKFTDAIRHRLRFKGKNKFYQELNYYLPEHLSRNNIIYVLNRIADELI